MTPGPVFVSSTGLDLRQYRDAVRQACDELGLGVVAMEDFEAMGLGATAGSLAKVDRAGVFVGVFAHRYGFVEPGYPVSVTECEFDHAKQRGLECLCFLVDPNHPWPDAHKEHAAKDRLDAFKARIMAGGERIVRRFTTPHDLLHQAYRALEGWLERQGVRPRGPRQLPAPPPDFVGRGDDLATLEGRPGGVTIAGVHGQGGVGKSALAYKLAERLLSRHPDGQVYLDLKGVEARPLTTRDAMAHVIHAFLPEQRLPESEAELAGLYRGVLHGKRVLLLYDNARDGRQVEPLLPPAGCTLLVTSRRRFRLAGLYGHDLDTLPEADAVTLLRVLAPRLGEATAQALAHQCGRLPLALRLAGSLLAVRDDLAPERYLERLRSARLSALDTAAQATDAERSVTETLRLSEGYLAEPLRTKWRELAVLADRFEPRWAAGVWAVDAPTAEDYLGTLRQNSLLDWDAATATYRLHDLVRDYADVALTDDDRQAAQRRHARHFLAVMEEANTLYTRGGEALREALRLFDHSWPDVQAAFSWARSQTEDREAQHLCVYLPLMAAYLLPLRQHPQDRVEWLTTAAEAARRVGDRSGEGCALGNLGLAYAALGRVDEAIGCYEKHLAIARKIGDRRGEGNALGNLGPAYADLGQVDKAVGFYEQALVIDREIGDRRGEGNALGNLGVAYADLGQVDKAVGFYEQVLEIAQEIGDRRSEGNTLGNLGSAYYRLGQVDKAVGFYEQRLVIAREIGDRRGEGNALGNLGLAYADLDQVDKAVGFYEQQLAIAREVGDRRGEGAALGNLGSAYAALDQVEKAIGYYEKQLVSAREIGDRRGDANACWNLGLVMEKSGRLAEAIPLMEVCVRFEQELGHPDAVNAAARVKQLRRRLAGESPQAPP
jgi:tetratricopeptide (TPR) repeat protein